MTKYADLPDVVAAIVAHLKEDIDVDSSTTLPDDFTAIEYVKILKASGNTLDPAGKIERAVVQFDVFSDNEADLWDFVTIVNRSIRSMQDVSHSDIVITAVQCISIGGIEKDPHTFIPFVSLSFNIISHAK